MELIAALYRCASDVAGGDERSPHWKRHDEQRAREGRRLAVQSDGEKNENLQILGRCDEADDVFKIPYQNSSKTPHYLGYCKICGKSEPITSDDHESVADHEYTNRMRSIQGCCHCCMFGSSHVVWGVLPRMCWCSRFFTRAGCSLFVGCFLGCVSMWCCVNCAIDCMICRIVVLCAGLTRLLGYIIMIVA